MPLPEEAGATVPEQLTRAPSRSGTGHRCTLERAPVHIGTVTGAPLPTLPPTFRPKRVLTRPPNGSGPDAEEVNAYIAEKRFEFTGAEFVNHYEAKGWMIGKTKMKSWRAACRTWQNRRDEEKKKKGNFTPSGGVKPREDYSNAGKTRRTVAAG